VRYSQEIAKLVITRIREGETLRQISRDESMPEFLDMLDWLKSSDNKLGEKTFNAAYHAAQEDRALAWEDQNIQDLIDAKESLQGDRTDQARLRAVEAMIGARRNHIKDQRESMKRVMGGSGNSGPTVVIRRFAPSPADA